MIDVDAILARVMARRTRERELHDRGVVMLQGWRRRTMDTSPKNQAALRYDAPKAPERQPQPGELLFEFERGTDRFRCELRDNAGAGVEVQFFKNGEFLYGQHFDPRLDRIRTSRQLAITWAELEREALLKNG